MAEEVQQDGQKTLVAFIVGLLIGGMLVWAFSGPEASAPEMNDDTTTTEEATNGDEDTTNEATSEATITTNTEDSSDTPAPTLQVGEGNIDVPNQPAGYAVEMDYAMYPVSEGWIGVREYNDGNLGYIKGVMRFSEEQGLVPENIELQYPTVAGREYAVVVFTEDGDRDFSLAGDVQLDEIYDTFTAE